MVKSVSDIGGVAREVGLVVLEDVGAQDDEGLFFLVFIDTTEVRVVNGNGTS